MVQTLHLLDPSLYLAYRTAWSREQSGTGWREKSGKDCKHSKVLMEGPQQGRAIKLLNMSRQQTIRCYWSAHRTSWPKWSFI